jgi:hypothetical protein
MTRQQLYLAAALLAVVALFVVACGSGGSAAVGGAVAIAELPKNDKGYADISVQQLAEMVTSQ